LACTKEPNTYSLSFDGDNPLLLHLLDHDGNEVMVISFYENGEIASFSVADNKRGFKLITNFDANSINSISIDDEISNYRNSTNFLINDEIILFRMEQFDTMLITEKILKNGDILIDRTQETAK
jgi:hypothetical protein